MSMSALIASPGAQQPASGLAPFTAAELSVARWDRWTLVRWVCYPLTAAAMWLVVLPIGVLIAVVARVLSLARRAARCRCCRRGGHRSSDSEFSTGPAAHTSKRFPTLRLAPMDELWLHDSVTNASIITAVLVFDGEFTLEQLRSLIQSRIIETPGMEKLQYIIENDGSGAPRRWVHDAQYRLEEHVIECARWKFGSVEEHEDRLAHYYHSDEDRGGVHVEDDSHRLLESLLSSIINRPIYHPRGRHSMWSFSLLPRCGRGCAVIFRAHHAIADGVLLSGVLLQAMMDPANEQATQPSRRSLWSHVSHSLRLFAGVLDALYTGPYHLLRLALNDDDDNYFHHRRVSANKNVAWSHEGISMSRIKRIRQYHNNQVSVNDIMMSVLLDAMNSTINEKQRAMTASKRARRFTQSHLHLLVPINIRTILSNHLITAPKLGNLFAVLLLKFGLRTDTSNTVTPSMAARQRLLALTKSMNAVKRSSLPLSMYLFMDLTVRLLPSSIARFCVDAFNDLASAIVTNNRSPDYPLAFAGRSLLYWCSWAPSRSHCALSQTILTYNQSMRVSFVVDRALGVTSEQLIQQFHRAFQALEASCGESESERVSTADAANLATDCARVSIPLDVPIATNASNASVAGSVAAEVSIAASISTGASYSDNTVVDGGVQPSVAEAPMLDVTMSWV